MSTDEAAEVTEVRDRITRFLATNFPQIRLHGGSAAIRDLDLVAGEVTIALGGACSGCGISPMTIQALETRLVREIPELSVVHAETGQGTDPRGFDPDDVPF